MRVLLDTSYAARGASGTGVYVERVTGALRKLGSLEVVEARQRIRLRPGRAGGALGPLRSLLNAALDGLWLHAGLPRAARLAGADVVHHPLPAHSRRIRVPQVVTIHDLAFVGLRDRYDPRWRVLAGRAYRRAASRAEAIVCPSEATAGDVVRLFGSEPDRIVVAPHGPGQVADGDAVAAAGAAAAPAAGPLLFVGDAEPRKNLDGLLTAYAAYRRSADAPADLVLAGTAAAAVPQAAGVVARPGPSREELLHLYRAARALVHPSLHEGFGLTPLEAMALGTPVLAVRSRAIEELCGDAALLVEPDGLADGLERIASDAGLRATLAERGRARAVGFSWAKSARRHVAAYTLAASGAMARPDTQ